MGERHNLAEQEPAVLASMLANLTEWWDSIQKSIADESACPHNPTLKTDDRSLVDHRKPIKVLDDDQGAAAAATNSTVLSKPPKVLGQYDQVWSDGNYSGDAERHGRLDTGLLLRWLNETNSNTMNFLLYDTDGHQYLDSK